jgi:iron complex transport system ATP-binding protein
MMIEVENLGFSYGQTEVLRNLSLAVESGMFVTVAGPNGAGKSTLINILSGVLKAGAGSVKVAGKDIAGYSIGELARQVAVVRQEFVPVFGYTVMETVAMARAARLSGLGFETESDIVAIRGSLEATDTLQFADRQLSQLSGGERQRVFIARALAQETPILLLDEPTSFLDLKHQVDTYDLLKKMQRELRKTIILISHDINVAAQYCDSILLLSSDKTYHFGKPEEILDAGLIAGVFQVHGFSGVLKSQRFFIPLGKLARDA